MNDQMHDEGQILDRETLTRLFVEMLEIEEDLSEPMDQASLIRFALGQSDENEEEAWLECLITSNDLRNELIVITDRLKQQSPQEFVSDPIYGEAFSQILSDAFLALKPNAVNVSKAIVQAIGEEWRRMFNTPKFALSRDSSTKLSYTVSSQNGNLVVDIEGDEKRASQTYAILLKDPFGTSIIIWQGEIDNFPKEIRIEDIAQQLGFPEGPLPAKILELAIDGPAAKSEGTIRLQILPMSKVEIPLLKPIRVSGGVLHLEADVSDVKRDKAWQVSLIAIFGSTALTLGKVQLEQEAKTLQIKASIPQTESFEFGGTSLLYLDVSN